MFDKEYYDRFPVTLKRALETKEVTFPEGLKTEYEDILVYRGVKLNNNKTTIDYTDFLSQRELHDIYGKPIINEDNGISEYSCSFFSNIEKMRTITKFPSKHKAIAKGYIKDAYGPIVVNKESSHIDLYRYDGVDMTSEFEVIETWRQNG